MKPFIPIHDPRFLYSGKTDVRVKMREVGGRLPTERAQHEREQAAIRAINKHAERLGI